MAYSYYIYYRVTPEKAESCEVRVLELMSAIKERTGIAGRLLKKRSEPLLWMEVYENVRDDAKFELALEQAVGQLDLADCLQDASERRGGRFVGGPPGAPPPFRGPPPPLPPAPRGQTPRGG